MQLSPAFCYFLTLQSEHSPQHPVLEYPQSMFLPDVRGQESHSYSITIISIEKETPFINPRSQSDINIKYGKEEK